MTDSAPTLRFGLRTRVAALSLGTAGLVALAISLLGYLSARDLAVRTEGARLESEVAIKADGLARWIGDVDRDVASMALGLVGQRILPVFAQAFAELGGTAEAALQRVYITENPHPTGSKQLLEAGGTMTAYDGVHAEWHAALRAIQENRGYYDLFVIDATGNIVYSVFKETDYATSLTAGRWAASGLGRAFARARDAGPGGGTVFEDFTRYGPSANAPAAFLAHGVFDAQGRFVGVVAIQLPIDLLTEIAMGEELADYSVTGRETYVIGRDGLLRTEADATPQDDILSTNLDTTPLARAFAGERIQAEMPGLTGVPVHLAAAPVQNRLLDWVLVAEVDVVAFYAPVAELRNGMILVAALGLILSAVAALLVARSVTRPIAAIGGAVDRITAGEFVAIPGKDRPDELGQLARQLEAMNLAKAQTDRLAAAIDAATAMYMITNGAREIVYLNASLAQFFEGVDAKMREAVPDFDAKRMIGRKIDDFHKNPAYQARMLDDLKGGHVARIEVAGKTMRLKVMPVYARDGYRLGWVTEWVDETADLAASRQITEVIKAIGQGELDLRVDTAAIDGYFAEAAGGINAVAALFADYLADLDRVLGGLAEGDLTQRLTGNRAGRFRTLADAANSAMDRLSDLVRDLSQTEARIQKASAGLLQGATDLSGRTEAQASSLQQTAATMEEMTANVRANADNAGRATELASAAANRAREGHGVVGHAVSAMSEISQSSERISDIISVIDAIAFQTNLLALNAAVEAARAGEAGKGFAVVASEVRTLAQRSAEAARDIKALIQDSATHVSRGVDLVHGTGKALEEIVGSVAQVADTIAEISAASREQSTGVEEISGAVSHMDEMTQANAAVAEESASSARTIADLAAELSRQVGFFQVEGGTARKVTAPPRAAAAEARHDADWQAVASVRRPAAKPEAKTAARPAAKTAVMAAPAARVASPAEDADWSEF
jgi:methyl-accepting chemotaxis protein